MTTKPNFPTVFEFEGRPAKMTMFRLRKQSETDAAAGAIELKIAVDGLPSAIAAALTGATPAEFARSFWRVEDADKVDADKGEQIGLRFVGLAPLVSESTYKQRHELKIAGIPPIRVDVINAFTLTPAAGQVVDVTFRVIIADPPEGWLEAAAGCYEQSKLITLRQDPELALDAPQDKPAKRTKPKADDQETRGDLFQQAVIVVTNKGTTSAAMLQEALKIGYERAMQLLADLENAGVIGAQDREGVHELKRAEAAPAPAPAPATPTRKPDRIGGAPVH